MDVTTIWVVIAVAFLLAEILVGMGYLGISLSLGAMVVALSLYLDWVSASHENALAFQLIILGKCLGMSYKLYL
jgi:membrane protein implicated in regulation of membrane protease activity